ncbi:alpha/beta fold hydrolase [Embleya hyalina]|uniref:Haloalkane dehalogenase n=1 Tax=Embleya hyalina TaxID=516124 RepID=A0A401Z684_9ACTN|nr:alpha/beta hydrolase [Embleya hyalina]GCE02349.1 haloalkane dehalogenase [Embleya hyalina]
MNTSAGRSVGADSPQPFVEAAEITAGGWVFNARVAGPAAGRPVLFLHGFPQTSASWTAQLLGLARAGHRAIAFDQRGYSPGARPPQESAYGRDELVGDVLAVLDTLGLDRVDLVGHDWGGALAWQVAGLAPERLHTLTVVSTPHPVALAAAVRDETSGQREQSSYIRLFRTRGAAEEKLLADDAAYLRALFASLPAEIAERHLAVLREPGALTGALNWYRAIDPKVLRDIGDIDTPTLYVWSDRDEAFGRTAAEATVDSVTGPYRFEVLRDVDHWVPENGAKALTGLLLEHLAAFPAR